MSRYIDADKLALFIVEHLPRSAPQDAYDAYFDVLQMLKDEKVVPTIAVGVKEVKHGYWIPVTYGECKCSICGNEYGLCGGLMGDYNYCPGCGARMDKEKEE